jgi:hypothetical protein
MLFFTRWCLDPFHYHFIISIRSFIIEHENEELGCIAIKWCAELFRVFGRQVPTPLPCRHASRLYIFLYSMSSTSSFVGGARPPQRARGVILRRVRAASDGFSATRAHAPPAEPIIVVIF